MPLFEFKCTSCESDFEELVISSSAVDRVICPACGSERVTKKISTFASKMSRGSSFSLGANSPASCSPGGV